jgi:hypothetical protein
MRKKLAVLAVALAAFVPAVPAQAVLDEGGGAAPTPDVSAAESGFGWGDAGIGAAVGAALAAMVGMGIAARRHHGQVRAGTGPATH